MKKLLTLALSICLMSTFSISANAEQLLVESPDNAEVVSLEEPSPILSSSAIIKDIAMDGEVTLLTLTTNNEMIPEVVAKVYSDTAIIDTQTGLPVSVETLKQNDKILVFVSSAMTRSIPPQANAIAIITNIQEDKPSARYFEALEVTKNDDGSVTILSSDKMYLVTVLPNETEISPYKTKQIVGINDIKVGSKFFGWFDIMTLSIPAQATLTKLVLLPEIIEDETDNKTISFKDIPTSVTINDSKVDLGELKLFMQYDELMVPLRLISEQLGFAITWNQATKTATLVDGTIKSEVQIGYDNYGKTVSGDEIIPLHFGVTPMLVNGTTFVPLKYFEMLFDEASIASIINGALFIKTA